MSESDQATVGQALREAREALGMRTEEAAARLRLMQRQIEAMETDDFESLGRPVFARGFVRNYARLLGIDAEALLSRMESPRTEPMTAMRRPEPPPQRSWLSSPWVLLLLLGLLAAVTVPVGLYWWLNQGEDEFVNHVPSTVRVEPVELDVPVAATPPAEAAAPATSAEPASDEPPAEPALDPVAPPAPEPEATRPAEAAAPAAPSANGVLHLEFADDAWVEIRDASGRMLHRQLNPAGSSVDVRGRPPFDVVIGNASQARVSYNGRPIDLKPFIGQSVARFTLEE